MAFVIKIPQRYFELKTIPITPVTLLIVLPSYSFKSVLCKQPQVLCGMRQGKKCMRIYKTSE